MNIAIIFQYPLLQHTNQIPLHIFVDFFRIRFSDSVGYAVAGEGAAIFFVAAEGADQVRVLDLLFPLLQSFLNFLFWQTDITFVKRFQMSRGILGRNDVMIHQLVEDK